jgi:hypothetical protein
LPQIAQGDANKVWIIPSEFTSAMEKAGEMLGKGGGPSPPPPPPRD